MQDKKIMRNLTKSVILFACIMTSSTSMMAQSDYQKVKDINHYGKMDHWSIREIEESNIIGGQIKHLYEFCGHPTDTTRGEIPFQAPKGYYWRSNNVWANVIGVIKTSNTDYPEKRGDGHCIRIETHIEEVKALNIINMDVVCQGALILGELPEPIRDTKNPLDKPLYGIPFHSSPRALEYDYKAVVGKETIRGTGFSKLKNMGYPDYPMAYIVLQRRYENNKGELHAKRVGTGVHIIKENTPEWVNGHRLNVHYGDISKEPFYTKDMQLMNGEKAIKGINSKGKKVTVIEDEWGDKNEIPNYMIIYFVSSSGKPFYGGVGNILWLDNIKLIM